MCVWTSMLLMLLTALLARRVLGVFPVAGEDGRKLLHQIGEMERLAIQLALAAVADPEEGILLVGQPAPLEDHADRVGWALRRVRRVRREKEHFPLADGDVVGLSVPQDAQ